MINKKIFLSKKRLGRHYPNIFRKHKLFFIYAQVSTRVGYVLRMRYIASLEYKIWMCNISILNTLLTLSHYVYLQADIMQGISPNGPTHYTVTIQ